MDARGVRRSRHQEEEESYFISMADMMVGLLFVFIVLLLYFALQFRQTTETLTGASETRRQILTQLEQRLKNRGLKVSIDTDTGVLRLPEDVLFDTGQADLTPEGLRAVGIVAYEMSAVLPCYTFPRPLKGCAVSPHRIDAIFVEGHTDSARMGGRGAIRDNLDLSAFRATNTYRRLIASAPRLADMMNVPPQEGDPLPILSVSGYGQHRPVDRTNTEDGNRRNRRIDLRFLMVTPRSPIADLLTDDQ